MHIYATAQADFNTSSMREEETARAGGDTLGHGVVNLPRSRAAKVDAKRKSEFLVHTAVTI